MATWATGPDTPNSFLMTTGRTSGQCVSSVARRLGSAPGWVFTHILESRYCAPSTHTDIHFHTNDFVLKVKKELLDSKINVDID
jgi:hypothetical protein